MSNRINTLGIQGRRFVAENWEEKKAFFRKYLFTTSRLMLHRKHLRSTHSQEFMEINEIAYWKEYKKGKIKQIAHHE